MVTDQNLHLRMQALMGIQEDIQNKNSYRPHVRSEAGYDITQTTVVIKTKVITGVNTRWSYVNAWEPKSINGGAPKYSVSLIIPKSDTKTIEKIQAAIQAAYDEGQDKLKGNGKSVPALSVLKTPLRDGDAERPDDEAYADSYFINANSGTAPGIVDADRQPILDRSEVYSGVYGRASINFYAFNSNGNKGIACGLSKCGVYKYVEATDFDILLFGYAVDGGEVIVVDLAAREKIPVEILAALADENITKWAFNSNFERVCLSEWLRRNHPEYFGSYSVDSDTVGNYLNPRGWECSMIWSAFMGLPLSLAGVGAVLGLEEQKLKEGKDLIRYFCVPCKATKSNGGRTRNLPEHDMDKWKLFKFYNQGDVEVEQSIQKKLVNYPVPDFVWEEFWLDQEINARGIQLDLTMVENAISLDEISKEKLVAAMREITDLDNPNSVAQMKVWLAEQGVEAESLGKKDVAKLMDEVEGDVKDALLLRQ